MIDLVYPIRQGASLQRDLELRYSLRSVQAHVRLELGQLHIFGWPPAFLTSDVRVVRMDDRGNKALNLLAKYRRMVDDPLVSDPFVLLDDDHIFLEDVDEIPLHTRGKLEDLRREFSGSTYGGYVGKCLELLRRAGLPERNYQIHRPLTIHKAALDRALELAGTNKTVMGSLYGNVLDGPTVEVTADYAIGNPRQIKALPTAAFVALTDRAAKDHAVQKHLATVLPERSRWER